MLDVFFSHVVVSALIAYVEHKFSTIGLFSSLPPLPTGVPKNERLSSPATGVRPLCSRIFYFFASDKLHSGIGGELVADDSQVISWNSAEAGIRTQETGSGFGDEVNISAIGRFAAIDLQLPQLRQLATASSVEGTIGGISLDFGAGIQSGLPNMLQKVIEAEKGSSSASQ